MILPIILVALAVFLWRINNKDQYLFVLLGHALLTIISIHLVAQHIQIGTDEKMSRGVLFTLLLSGVLAFHFVLSRFWKNKAPYFPPLFVLLSSSVFFLFSKTPFIYNGFEVSFDSLIVVLLPFLGSCIEPIANLKETKVAEFFKIDFKSRRGISRSSFLFLIGFFGFIAHFTASYIGLAMLSLGYASSLFYHKKPGTLWNMLLALLAVTLLGYFSQIAQITESSLLLGRVFMGIFCGASILLYTNTMGRAKKNNQLADATSWLLILLIPSALIMAVTQNVNFGGGDAFIGLLVGFSLTAALGINVRKNDSALSVFMALGVLLLPLTINKEAEKMSVISVGDLQAEEKEEAEDLFEMAGKQIDLEGSYEIVSENSQLTFELGPTGGRTKGAFQSFTGRFSFNSTNKFEVQLPVREITTFNDFRDESLMEKAYFNQAEFPEMKFSTTSFEQKGEVYQATGNITMLGVTKEIVLEMKYLGKTSGSKNGVFIGKSSLNRVDFGMASDPKEGNVVDFQFKVELKKVN